MDPKFIANDSQELPATQDTSSVDYFNPNESSTWGRLLSLKKHVQYYDLVEDSYSFGRGNVDCVLHEGNFDKDILPTVSKKHFRIHRSATGSGSMVILEDYSLNGTAVNGILLGKGNRKPLRHGDQIALTNQFIKVFVFYDCHDNVNYQYPEIMSSYTIIKQIGKGTYGEVCLAFSNNLLERFAVKILKKNIMSANGTTVRFNNLPVINNEVELLKSVNHPCIIRFYDYIESLDKIFVIMEYADGGDLYSRITETGCLKEEIAQLYFCQMLHAVAYLHDKKITHRDIKPENILLENLNVKTRIKLTDFGLSKLAEDRSIMTTFCGTQNYIAPELITVPSTERRYSNKVDMWSLGIVLYACLSGELPFGGKTEKEKFFNISRGRFGFQSQIWTLISDPAKTVIKKLLVVDSHARLSARESLNLPWLMSPDLMKEFKELLPNQGSMNYK